MGPNGLLNGPLLNKQQHVLIVKSEHFEGFPGNRHLGELLHFLPGGNSQEYMTEALPSLV